MTLGWFFHMFNHENEHSVYLWNDFELSAKVSLNPYKMYMLLGIQFHTIISSQGHKLLLNH